MSAHPLEVSIKRATAADADALLSLVNESYRGSGNWTNEQGMVAGPRTTLPALRQLLRKADEEGEAAQEFVLTAWSGEQLVGCVEVSSTDAAASVASEGDGPRDGYLGMLSVDSRVGSQGIGRKLMDAGEAACASVFGTRCVVLFVLSLRADISAWYARRGYVSTGLSVGAANAKAMVESLHEDAKFLVDGADFVIIRKRLDAAPAAA